MTDSSKRAWATIDLHALKKNLSKVSVRCPESKIVPVIKANAYGHGVDQVAKILRESHHKLAAVAVATIDEALQLRTLGFNTPIMLLPGFRNSEEMNLCLNHNIEPVVHSVEQVAALDAYLEKEILSGVGRVWVKLNTGMNRLGLSSENALQAYGDFHKHPGTEVVLMSHLGWADDPEDSSAAKFTQQQIAEFNAAREKLKQLTQGPVGSSLAASSGILNLPETHHQFVRPGIMLYGSSPLSNRTSEEIGLLPVMTLSARLIAINEVKAGQSIGYGATHTCKQDTRVGVVSIGYADGYPRAAKNGTPVLVRSASGDKRTILIGRVSMDMITIDLTTMDDANIDDEVVLWGKGLPVDEVAISAGTIAYELFCKVTNRVSFEYLGN